LFVCSIAELIQISVHLVVSVIEGSKQLFE